MSSIELQNVTKTFDDTTAVDSIDLQVRDGEFLVLVGPSGCGKSTTLRLIAGLETPDDGTVRIGGNEVNDREPSERDVSMIFQDYALFPHMTARENITFGLNASESYTSTEVTERVQTAAEKLEIENLLDRKPGQLSGGEQQRVAMGRSIVRDPEVFLMDEPLANLDAKLRVGMRTELAALHDELGTTTVYVTHDQTEAMTLGDRVAVMNDGSIEQVARPQELYEFPRTRFVATFIGTPAMNLFPVEVKRNQRQYRIHHGEFALPLPAGSDRNEVSEGEYVFGIRPENLTIASQGGTEGASIPVKVSRTELLGDKLVVHGEAGESTLRIVTYDLHDVERGAQVYATHDPDRVHLFDPDTGRALYHAKAARTSEATTDRDRVVGEDVR
jgi:multiple sugar transport system ATP-binding protein